MGYPALNDSEHHDNQVGIFSRLGGELSAARTPIDAARTILKAADQLLHWDAYVFNLLGNTSENVMSILCVDTVDGARKEFTPDVNSSKIGQIARQSMKEGGKLILRAPGNLLPEEAIPFGNKSRPSASLMYVPLRKGAQSLGFLSLQSYSFHAYTEEDLTTLQALADHCGGALERIRAEAEVERLNQELRHRLQELHVLNTELELRVQQRTAELGAINKELQAFCYSVSHDLRAPLRSIRGFSEVLLERYSSVLDERGLEYLKRVCHSCQHMDALVEDLLKLSRLSRAELKPKDVDLSAICDSILTDLKRSEPAREVELSVAPGAPCAWRRTLNAGSA